MWVFTTRGFFSAVRFGRDRVSVRARKKEHLQALRRRHGIRSKIRRWPAADYEWRIVVGRRAWARIMAAEAAEVDYPNFKDAAAEAGAYPPGLLAWVWGKTKTELEGVFEK